MKVTNYFKTILFNFLYGKYVQIGTLKKNKKIKKKKIFFKSLKKNAYNIYFVKNAISYLGSIHDHAVIVDNKIISDLSYQYRFNKKKLIYNSNASNNVVLKTGVIGFKKKLNENVLSLLTGGAGKHNYFHWLFDVLPRIAIFEKAKVKIKNLKLLLPSLKLNYQIQTLKALEIKEKNCLDVSKYKHSYIKSLIVTDHPYVANNNPTKSILNIPLWIILWLRKKFLKKKLKKFKFYKKIYIDRSDSKFSDKRKIINENEIKNYLIKNNFTSIVLSEYSFEQQVQIFNNAKIIIGLHGAGFANIIFSNPGTNIIELQSVQSGNVLKNLSKKCNLRYYKITSNHKSNEYENLHGKILINIKSIKKKLNQIK